MRRGKIKLVCLVLLLILIGSNLALALSSDERAAFITNVKKYSIDEIATMSVEELAEKFYWKVKGDRYVDQFFNISISKQFHPWEREAFIWRIRILKWSLGL